MKKNLLLLIISFSAINLTNAQWTSVNVPHKNSSFPLDVEVPNETTVWAAVSETSGLPPTSKTNVFLRTADNGVTWLKSTIAEAPRDYNISNLFPIDADTCYAAMYDAAPAAGTLGGGGIFKTTDGGITWSQLGAGLIFDENSFPDFVYFWDVQHGIALGDFNLIPGTEEVSLEVYTTDDYGNTWTRVPKENLPAFTDRPIGITNNYCVFDGKLWCQVFDGVPGTGAPQFVYQTDDMGHTWASYPITTPSDFNDIVFTDRMNGVVTGSTSAAGGGTAFLSRTSDGGETWSDVSYTGPLMWSFISNVPGTSALVSCAANTNGGTTGSSYSWDLGSTWTQIDDGSNGVTGVHGDVKFLNSSIGWSGQQVPAALSGGMYQWTGSILPVIISSFNVSKAGKAAMLNWQTSSELNFSYFGIERSTNGINFNEIGKVNALGNSSIRQLYSFQDLAYANGLNYYRLKLVNKDGSFNYSITQKLDMSLLATIRLRPNPVRDILTVEGLNASVKAVLSILNSSGRLMQRITTTEAAHSFNVAQLAAGNYYVRIEADGKVSTLKFVKQ